MDKTLIMRAMQGDEGAFSDIYYSTYRTAYGIAYNILKNEQEAQDALQDSFITAFEKLNQLQNPEMFESWLYRIVSNRCKDLLRKNKPILFCEMQSQDEDDSYADIQFPEFEDQSFNFQPEKVLDRNETRRIVKEILDTLPDDQRISILMYYESEMKISDIANYFGVSENTVKSRLSYGKKKIAEKVEEYQKRGTKLYGITAVGILPLISWLGKNKIGVGIPSPENIFSSISVSKVGEFVNNIPNSNVENSEFTGQYNNLGQAYADQPGQMYASQPGQAYANQPGQACASGYQQVANGFGNAANYAAEGASGIATGALGQTVSNMASGAVGGVAKKAGKHIFIKVMATILATSLAMTTVVYFVKPELLYPIDFLGIVTPGPIKTVEKLENAINTYDYEAILDCIDPRSSSIVKGGASILEFGLDLLGIPSVDWGSLASMVGAAYGYQVDFDVTDYNIEDDTATVTINAEMKYDGATETEVFTADMVKVGDDWYFDISDDEAFNDFLSPLTDY